MVDENSSQTVLRAFTVTEFDSEISVVVFATSHADARTVALLSPWFEGSEWINLRAHREPRLDAHAATYGRTYLAFDTPEQVRLARSLEWYEINTSMELPCERCALFEWELLPESKIGEGGVCAGCAAEAVSA